MTPLFSISRRPYINITDTCVSVICAWAWVFNSDLPPRPCLAAAAARHVDIASLPFVCYTYRLRSRCTANLAPLLESPSLANRVFETPAIRCTLVIADARAYTIYYVVIDMLVIAILSANPAQQQWRPFPAFFSHYCNEPRPYANVTPVIPAEIYGRVR